MEKEKLISMLKGAIVNGDVKRGSKILENAKISKIETIYVNTCDNPDFNYAFNGVGTVKMTIETGNGDDSFEEPKCEFSGYAMVKDNELSIVKGVSLKRDLPHIHS